MHALSVCTTGHHTPAATPCRIDDTILRYTYSLCKTPGDRRRVSGRRASPGPHRLLAMGWLTTP